MDDSLAEAVEVVLHPAMTDKMELGLHLELAACPCPGKVVALQYQLKTALSGTRGPAAYAEHFFENRAL